MKKATTKATLPTNHDLLDQFADALLRATIEVNAASEAITPDRVAPLSAQAVRAAKAWGTKLLELGDALPALVNELNPPTAPKPSHLRLV